MAALVNGPKVCLVAHANAWLRPRNLRSWLSPLAGDFGEPHHGGQGHPDLSTQGQLVTIWRLSAAAPLGMRGAVATATCGARRQHLDCTPMIQFTDVEIHNCVTTGDVHSALKNYKKACTEKKVPLPCPCSSPSQPSYRQAPSFLCVLPDCLGQSPANCSLGWLPDFMGRVRARLFTCCPWLLSCRGGGAEQL